MIINKNIVNEILKDNILTNEEKDLGIEVLSFLQEGRSDDFILKHIDRKVTMIQRGGNN